MRVALVNTNRVEPPIAPIGLDYVAEALQASGHRVELLDLCWAPDPNDAIARFFNANDFGLVGITLRNTDDCGFATRHSYLGEFAEFVASVRRCTDASIILGGVGFSVMPEAVLDLANADAGVWGEGEFAFPAIADRIEAGEGWQDVSNLVYLRNGTWTRNPPATRSLADLPPMSRKWVDNRRYFQHGGQAGFETKRGCPGECVYCADPVAKGRQVRTRSPAAIADEIERLLAQGIDHLHTCDGEFNIPEDHALAVCQEIVRRGLGDRLHWYAYCSPAPFSPDLAREMRAAGCAGINFGADNGDDSMLRRLRRGFSAADILAAVRRSKDAGMTVMLDLLLGSPGETRESLDRTVELVRASGADRVGVSVGVRLYPDTELYTRLSEQSLSAGIEGGQDTSEPLFFLDPAVQPSVYELLDSLIGDDPRFLFFHPSRPERNYNYDNNHRLIAAIRQGYRGAYWDILRRCG